MKTRKNIYSFAALLVGLWSVAGAFAQTKSTVGNDEVIVITEHDAKIKDADKISTAPAVPQLEDPKVNPDYKIPSHEFKDVQIDPNPLKPIALSKEKTERFNRSYINLGFGSQLSPLAEIVYNGKSKIRHYGVEASHFSAFPFGIKNQQFHDTKAGAYFKVYPSNYMIGADFRLHNLLTHFYGLQNRETQSRKQIQQDLLDFDGKIQFASAKKNSQHIDFNSALRGGYFKEFSGKSNEFFIHGNFAAAKTFLVHHNAGASFDFDVSRFNSTVQNLWREYYLLKLFYTYTDERFLARGAFTFGIQQIGTASTFYPLPDLYFQARLYQKAIYAYAGWDIAYLKNSFRDFAWQNNFAQSDLQLQNSRISDLKIGVKGTQSGFSYKAQFSYKYVWNQAFFYTDAFDVRRFQTGYFVNLKSLNPHLELGYNYRDDFTALFCLDYNKYIVPNAGLSSEKAWYMPNFTANLKLRYNIKDKFILGTDIYGFTAYYGYLASLDTGFPNPLFKQNGTADANLSIEYLFNKHVSFFGYLNNLANRKYQRFANYPVFGINGIAGVKYAF